MASNALSLLFGLIIFAAVIPYLFGLFDRLQQSVEGSCVAKHIQTIPPSVAEPYPVDGTTWSIGQDWQTGGPFIDESVPGIPSTCNATMPPRLTGLDISDPNEWGQTFDSDSPYILYAYTPTDFSERDFFPGLISGLIDLAPLGAGIGIIGLVGTFAWKAFGNRRA